MKLLFDENVSPKLVGLVEAEVTNRLSREIELSNEPSCEVRRELLVQPDYHAARTGWSSR